MTTCRECIDLLRRIGAMGLSRDEVLDDVEMEAEHARHQGGRRG